MLNTTINTITKSTPFKLVFKFTLSLNINIIQDTQARRSKGQPENQDTKAAAASVEDALQVLKEIQEIANKQIERYYNKKRKPIDFKPGFLVRLATRNIHIQQAHKKLADKFIGLFKVDVRVGTNTY